MPNLIASLLRRFQQPPPLSGTVLQDRLFTYDLFDGYYNNTVFNSAVYGGQREHLNALLGNATMSKLVGLYNPVSEVCDLYAHTLAGAFGDEITVEPGPQAAQIAEPLAQVWQWSNIDQAKQLLTRWAPNHGNVGLRIVADRERGRVYLKPEHPRVIRDIQFDDRGNVIAAEFQYEETTGIGDEREIIIIRERQDKEQFQLWTVTTGGALVLRESYPNELGVVPYVLLAHQPSGETWGFNAYYRALPLINELNALASQIDQQIAYHVRAKLAVSASGTAPTTFSMDDLDIAYFNTSIGDKPTYEWLVAPLNLADAITQSEKLLSAVEDKLPELKAISGKFLSGQSGETIAQLRQPAEDRLSLARTNYEDALIRAQEIALSWGVLYGLWNLGTGTGTREAADAAYKGGFEEHTFNTRPLLPMTDQEAATAKTNQVNQLSISVRDLGLSKNQALKELGYTDKDITTMETARLAETTTAADAFGSLFDRGVTA